ncbi:hypothetical protein JTE90_011415 [Oedothorax gibbosus]|uniref:Ig-like domain-containing protein n=1 Tax=Oedothorax gibbosus TaxID=931172 RepID=A0AAV6TS33_9ARAC|nr:hypothetical protein JTE90_011415 [Oedothorax gibbosus]
MVILLFTFVVLQVRSTIAQDAPVIQPFNFPEFSTTGQTAIVTCAVSKGTRPLQFSWLKDGKDIENIPNASVHNGPGFSVLTVGPASKENVGNFTCVARNMHGQNSYTSQFILNEPPVWVNEPQDVRVIENDFLELICTASGHPLPKISWSKVTGDNSGPSTNIGSTSNAQIFSNGSLIINSIKHEDDGTYTCTVSNDIGTALQKTIAIVVSGKNKKVL